MTKLEELLNKLIEKGWKPRMPNEEKIFISVREKEKIIIISHDGIHGFPVSYRDIVSKESGLWQFVCENGMVDGVDRWTLNAKQKSIYDKYITSEKEYTPKMNYEYRLIESALCDEDKLEQFLLDNIKI